MHRSKSIVIVAVHAAEQLQGAVHSYLCCWSKCGASVRYFWTLHVMHAYERDSCCAACTASDRCIAQACGLWSAVSCNDASDTMLGTSLWIDSGIQGGFSGQSPASSSIGIVCLRDVRRWIRVWLIDAHPLPFHKIQLLQQSALWLCFILMHAMLHHRWGNIHKVSHTSISSTKALSSWLRRSLWSPHQYHAQRMSSSNLNRVFTNVNRWQQQVLPTDSSQVSVNVNIKLYCKPVPWAILCCLAEHVLCLHHTIYVQCSRLSSCAMLKIQQHHQV